MDRWKPFGWGKAALARAMGIFFFVSGCSPVTQTMGHIQNMDGQMGKMGQALTALPRVERELGGLSEQLGTLTDHTERLGTMEQRLDAMDKNLARMAGQFGALSSPLGELPGMSQSLRQTNARLDGLASMPGEATEVNRQLGVVDRGIKDMKGQLAPLQAIGALAEGASEALKWKWAACAVIALLVLLNLVSQWRLQSALRALARPARRSLEPQAAERVGAEDSQPDVAGLLAGRTDSVTLPT